MIDCMVMMEMMERQEEFFSMCEDLPYALREAIKVTPSEEESMEWMAGRCELLTSLHEDGGIPDLVNSRAEFLSEGFDIPGKDWVTWMSRTMPPLTTLLDVASFKNWPINYFPRKGN